jgi:predicted aldo/keto reductase-like oxidoreductase
VDVGIYDVIMTAYNFRQTNISEIDEALAYANANGIGIIAMKTMAGGYWDKDRNEAINKKASLKWSLKNEHIHTAVPGFSTFDQMYEDLSVMEDLQLTEQETLDLKLAETNFPTGIFCQQCGTCLSQCKKHYDIPTAMRSYMYAYGYQNLKLAQLCLKDARLPEDPCSECDSCRVKCTMEFDVRRKLIDITRLKNIPGNFPTVNSHVTTRILTSNG